ncbi:MULTISPECIES: hypothetical protein [Pseudonocardia]|uniref:Uncharacterized protein n=2 Tax=Pseudonocardia TaxID=1847 RepID=A0A1Y2N9W7_PSEAH|nr:MULTISPECIES: hypothetical protein [Pseudonocardia]OSY43688.1 hypothetical protein BG845_00634 [Pseudonocardia autotrophica]TDN73322.1 hypothetical protein C8E95_2415 [Pseudonocardia autotrophica]BBG04060.1 hypothetical protein Pdca_52690 [Pseudonocardia autotrophica]GEC26197.1 hypothetical protein PSA01_32260 [Pseudonocardia saturnea]
MNAPEPGQVLRAARRRDSATKRARVRDAIAELEQAGDPISFAAVARAAQVSTWLVYADGVREHITAAQQRHQLRPEQERRAGLRPSEASLRTDLALARDELGELRADRDQLREHLRRQLGRDLDTLATADLHTRVEELTHHNQRITDDLARAYADNQALRARVTALETELGASRTSLRRMIRDQNLEQP